MKKHLNIQIDGEPNIGVLELHFGENEFTASNKKLDVTIKQLVEPKLVEALKSHFDCPIKIILTEVKHHTPLTLEVAVIVESDDEDRQETVNLEETWVY